MNATTQTATATATGADAEAQQKLQELLAILGKGSLGADQVRELVRAEIAANKHALEAQITEALASLKIARAVTLKIEALPPRDVGIQHKHFEKLLKACHARLRGGNRLNIWLYGPAGTGKTTAAENVAQALQLPFYCTGTLSTAFELIGYRTANGETIRTPFRECFEHGGIFLFDEIDSSDPRAGLALNSALANGVCAFPDKIVKRHPDCVIIAGANTTGLGSSIEYVGRAKQDAAFMNRFVKIDWPLDEALESTMCADQAWLARVRQVRANVKSRGIKGVMVSPRATVYGEALLAAGLSQQDVEEMVLRGGLEESQWRQIA